MYIYVTIMQGFKNSKNPNFKRFSVILDWKIAKDIKHEEFGDIPFIYFI